MAVSLTPNLTTYFLVNYPYKNLSGLQDNFSKKPHFFLYIYIIDVHTISCNYVDVYPQKQV